MLLKEFKFTYIENQKKTKEYRTFDDCQTLGGETVCLPHDVALSVTEHKTSDQLFFGSNIKSLQDKENLHCYYYTKFSAKEGKYNLILNRVDVFSEIYINGELVLTTDNAFISHETEVYLKPSNEIVIHLLPAELKARELTPPVSVNFLQYSYPFAYMRKPIHQSGWDILPRNLLGGIFDVVRFEEVKTDFIKDVYFCTADLKEDSASVIVSYSLSISGDKLSDYEIKVSGKCEDSEFGSKVSVWGIANKLKYEVKNPKLWTINNFGKANLYTLTLTLYKKGNPIDVYERKVGIRRIELKYKNDDNGGVFDFVVNGERAFIKGLNWVPLSPFHSEAEDKMDEALALMTDTKINMVRVWGGGYYESEKFYDYCDEHGILVWQDFMMACGIYPWDDEFSKIMTKEVTYIVKRLRNHSSLAVWVGDNECDMFATNFDKHVNPNDNVITRKVIPNLIKIHDWSRVYIPSSPWIDEYVYKNGCQPSEAHTWGPRDFFKSEYYTHLLSAFISENGYMGFPNISAIKKFISKPVLEDFYNEEYMLHSTNPEKDGAYSFRMAMTINEATETFGSEPKTLKDVVVQTQIAQAEAVKFFIEDMRVGKVRRGGILIWNLVDGWPQISDSIVDYYQTKKPVYKYLQNSYENLALIISETDDTAKLNVVNDTLKDERFTFEVVDWETKKVICQGTDSIKSNGYKDLCSWKKDGQRFYVIRWTIDGKAYVNHFITDIKNVPVEKYLSFAKDMGFSYPDAE
ncbi:MAG: hypothetical protein E7369_04350 [Clostridiales bacterium]|nr:hypothetical protein [Clostridiales bacterium]